MSGRLGGVPGGESRFRLLVIIREAAGRKSKEESPVRRGPGKGGRLGKATLGLNGLYCQDWEAWGGPVFQGLVQPPGPGGPFLRPRPDVLSTLHPSVLCTIIQPCAEFFPPPPPQPCFPPGPSSSRKHTPSRGACYLSICCLAGSQLPQYQWACSVSSFRSPLRLRLLREHFSDCPLNHYHFYPTLFFFIVHITAGCACMLSHFSCVRLYTMDCSLPGSSVHGILQARILEWEAMSSSRGSSQPRD